MTCKSTGRVMDPTDDSMVQKSIRLPPRSCGKRVFPSGITVHTNTRLLVEGSCLGCILLHAMEAPLVMHWQPAYTLTRGKRLFCTL